MFNPWKKRIQKLGDTKLSSEEKADLKSSILSYMEFHPVKNVELARQFKYRSTLEFLSIRKFMPIALVIALLLSGSVSFAAENSLPGDVLYPVKVNVNEEVRELVSLRAESKAEWQTIRAERRIEEAEKLAIKGELKADVIEKLEEKFENHAEKVEEKIAKLEAEGNVEAAAKLSGALEVAMESHSKVLTQLSASSTSTTTVRLIPLGLLVKIKGEIAENWRERMEDNLRDLPEVEVKAAAEGKIGAAENKIESTAKFLELKKDSLTAEGYAKASAKMASSTESLIEAKASLEDGEYAEAFLGATHAMILAQEAKAAVSIHLKLDSQLDIKSLINGNSGRHSDDSNDSSDDDDVDEVKKEDAEDIRGRNILDGSLDLDLSL